MTTKDNQQSELAEKKEVKELKKDFKLYQVALANTNHSKRRQELEQKIEVARDRLIELGVDPDSPEPEPEEKAEEKAKESSIPVVPNKVEQAVIPANGSRTGWMVVLLTIGAAAAFLLIQNLNKPEE